MSELDKINKLVSMKQYELAAFYKGRYERNNATFLKRYKFLNKFKEYLKGLEYSHTIH